nr:hypothetical protein [Gemmatimonadales bacterium]NIN11956.1 hypothetical protein [Gemmatimonadales bacterium]NIR03245.1 hypothetical protein [Gemmatimonadales bacterium]NIS66931.1 hypothetical protein [Gemmatimonadales bacterium]
MVSLRFGSVLVVMTVFVALSAHAQSSWCRYKERRLQEIVEQHVEHMQGSDGPSFTADRFPSRVRVIYTGKRRPIPTARRDFIKSYFTQFVRQPQYAELFDDELLFLEGTVQHWLPVQRELVPKLMAEASAGGFVELFAVWLGA